MHFHKILCTHLSSPVCKHQPKLAQKSVQRLLQLVKSLLLLAAAAVVRGASKYSAQAPHDWKNPLTKNFPDRETISLYDIVFIMVTSFWRIASTEGLPSAQWACRHEEQFLQTTSKGFIGGSKNEMSLGEKQTTPRFSHGFMSEMLH